MNQSWLIRTTKNQLLGPFPKEEVIGKIRRGELGAQDEACAGNGYWFSLHEREEMLRQLGTELAKIANEEEEITETDTATLTQTQPNVEITAPMDGAAAKGAASSKSAGVSSPSVSPRETLAVEQSSVLRIFIWIGIFAVLFLLYEVFRTIYES